MRKKHSSFSIGTVLTLLITMIVVVGSFAVFFFINSGSTSLDPHSLIDALGNISSGNKKETVQPSSSIKTTIVTPNPNMQKEQTAEPGRVTRSFTLTVGGLLRFESDINASVRQNNGQYEYASLFNYLSDSVHSDLNFVFSGSIYSSDDNAQSDSYANVSALTAIRNCGFDGLLMGNKYMLNGGMDGLANTISAAEENGISVFGLYQSASDNVPIIQVNGLQLAVLSYTENYTAEGKKAISEDRRNNVLRQLKLTQLQQDITYARANGADVIMVAIDWDESTATQTTTTQVEFVKQIANLGADIIIGLRSEAVQPITYLNVSDSSGKSRKVLIAYSLGTLLSDSRNEMRTAGLLMNVTVRYNESTNEVTFDSLSCTPTYLWQQSIDKKNRYFIYPSSYEAQSFMNTQQKKAMQNAYALIEKTLVNSPVTIRKDN